VERFTADLLLWRQSQALYRLDTRPSQHVWESGFARQHQYSLLYYLFTSGGVWIETTSPLVLKRGLEG